MPSADSCHGNMQDAVFANARFVWACQDAAILSSQSPQGARQRRLHTSVTRRHVTYAKDEANSSDGQTAMVINCSILAQSGVARHGNE